MVSSGVQQNGTKMIWSLIVIISITGVNFAAVDNALSRSAYCITQENKRLAGNVVERFESTNLMSCSQSCLRKSWCSSTNFKLASKEGEKGTCELIKHEINSIKAGPNLIDLPGVVSSMFLKGCLMTGCLNGGSCLFHKGNGTFTCSCLQPWSGDRCEIKIVKSCQEHESMGKKRDGIYNINPDGQGIFRVFCDQTTDGGGWIVVQRRIAPYNVSFDRVWTEYRNGFGDLMGEFWLGNDDLHRIAASASVVRFDLTADSGKKGYAKYGGFTVGDAATKFQWDMNTYEGNIGNAIYENSHTWHNIRGMKFSTKDKDNDKYSGGACDPGWWVNHCGTVNLNSRSGPFWGNWDKIVYTEMKIRKN